MTSATGWGATWSSSQTRHPRLRPGEGDKLATFGLALPGFASRLATGCGMAQQRTGSVHRDLEVGRRPRRFHRSNTEWSMVMIIGVDPHKVLHTATAVDPATNTQVASLRVDASLAGYRELLR